MESKSWAGDTARKLIKNLQHHISVAALHLRDLTFAIAKVVQSELPLDVLTPEPAAAGFVSWIGFSWPRFALSSQIT